MAADPGTCELLCMDLPKGEAARARLPDGNRLEAWPTGAKALADPTRLAAAIALAESQLARVCDLAWIVGRDEKLLFHHHTRALLAAVTATPASA